MKCKYYQLNLVEREFPSLTPLKFSRFNVKSGKKLFLKNYLKYFKILIINNLSIFKLYFTALNQIEHGLFSQTLSYLTQLFFSAFLFSVLDYPSPLFRLFAIFPVGNFQQLISAV